MLRERYNPPVSQLFEAGDIEFSNKIPWQDYIEKYGFTKADVPELLRMATDGDLEMSEEDAESFAPIHAWRALGQLRAEEAIEPLIANLATADDYLVNDSSTIFGLLGPAAIEPLVKAWDEDTDDFALLSTEAVSGLTAIAKQHPATEGRITDIMLGKLAKHEENDPGINGFVIQYLVDHKVEAARQLIGEAFEADTVDEMVFRLHDVQFGYGEITEEEHAKLEQEYRRQYRAMNNISTSPGKEKSPTRKAKAKRKIEKASRKKNRKK